MSKEKFNLYQNRIIMQDKTMDIPDHEYFDILFFFN